MREIQSLIGPVGWSEAPVVIQGVEGRPILFAADRVRALADDPIMRFYAGNNSGHARG
jgi:hypothetical protein